MPGAGRLALVLAASLAGEGADGGGEWRVARAALERDSRLERLLGELEGARRNGLRAVEERLGLSPGKRAIEWRLVERLEPLAGEAPRERAADGEFHAAQTRFEGHRVVVEVPARRYLARPRKVHPVVAHEAAHAVLASLLAAPERYAAVPAWFREGIALAVSGEGEWRVGERIAAVVADGAPAESFLAGVGRKTAAGGVPPAPEEGYLAVAWLERRLGAGEMRQLAFRVAAGEDLDAELRARLGLDPQELRAQALADARSAVRTLLSPAAERAFTVALARHRAGDRAGAASAFGALAASPEARALATTCRYLEARTLAEGGEPARAAEALILLLRGDREVLWEPEILEQLGSCERALNRPLRARRYWDEVLERFPEDRVVGARIRARLAESRSAPEGDR